MINNNFLSLYAIGMFRGGISGPSSNEDDRGQPKPWYTFVWILATILWVVVIINLYKQTHFYEVHKNYDGKVIHLYEEPRNDKYGNTIEIERFLIVKFDSVVEPFEVLVTPNTYFSSQEGKRVSFSLSNRDIYEAIYPKKFNGYIWKSTFSTTYILVYLLIFFMCGIPWIKYYLGKNSWIFKH